ncbi:MAG: DUF2314 domain-containing protein [Planctomycetes bacterium]|nr:DUF2314 domain-containing protein [Planctomycetota bacterium]
MIGYGLAAVGVGLLIGLVFWRVVRSRETLVGGQSPKADSDESGRLISIVALLKREQPLDLVLLAAAARRAWGADLGDGSSEGEDGFVAGTPLNALLRWSDRMILVHSIPKPYVNDPAEVARKLRDIRLRNVMIHHEAWLSCDAMLTNEVPSDTELQRWYRVLGRLLAQLIDEENCLGIFVLDENRLYAFNRETVKALQSDDPRRSLEQSAEVLVVAVRDDDPRMQAAVEEARRRWPEFERAFRSGAGELFGVKAPIRRNEETEFIWIEVTAIEGGIIYGKLANEPVNLTGLRLGSRVQVPVRRVNDWSYLCNDELVGAFTVKVLREASREENNFDSE